MGLELLVLPLAIIGVAGFLLAAILVIRARGRTWFAIPLFAGLLFCAWNARGDRQWEQTVDHFLLSLGLFVAFISPFIGLGFVLRHLWSTSDYLPSEDQHATKHVDTSKTDI